MQESRKNSLRDFVSVAGPLGVTHFVMLSATDNSSYIKFAKTPRVRARARAPAQGCTGGGVVARPLGLHARQPDGTERRKEREGRRHGPREGVSGAQCGGVDGGARAARAVVSTDAEDASR